MRRGARRPIWGEGSVFYEGGQQTRLRLGASRFSEQLFFGGGGLARALSEGGQMWNGDPPFSRDTHFANAQSNACESYTRDLSSNLPAYGSGLTRIRFGI